MCCSVKHQVSKELTASVSLRTTFN